jgi:hypothetical protein
MINRRQFTRILFSIEANLVIENVPYTITIDDISLNGVLVSLTKVTPSLKDKTGVLTFSLNEGDSIVRMDVAVVYEKDLEIGLQCRAIDIDSVTHLRRLVELNLGDSEQLNKELSQLQKNV